jgi:hypothetical protein
MYSETNARRNRAAQLTLTLQTHELDQFTPDDKRRSLRGAYSQDRNSDERSGMRTGVTPKVGSGGLCAVYIPIFPARL